MDTQNESPLKYEFADQAVNTTLDPDEPLNVVSAKEIDDLNRILAKLDTSDSQHMVNTVAAKVSDVEVISHLVAKEIDAKTSSDLNTLATSSLDKDTFEAKATVIAAAIAGNLSAKIGFIRDDKDKPTLDMVRCKAFLLKHVKSVIKQSQDDVDSKPNSTLLVYDFTQSVFVNARDVLARVIYFLLSYCVEMDIWSQNRERTLITLLKKASQILPEDAFDHQYIAFKSVDLDTQTLDFIDPNPEHHCLYPVDIKPDKDAKSPEFDHFMLTTFPLADDREHVIQSMAYTMERVKSEPMFWIWYSSGASGKSVLTKVFENLHPEQRISSASIQSLSGEFGLAPLRNSELNITSENGAGLADPTALKAITSNDKVQINVKFGDQFSTNLSTAFIFATNSLFPMSENTLGIRRRLKLLKFSQTFVGKNADPHLSEKLRKEMPGILNQVIAAWKSLRASNWDMTTSNQMEEDIAAYFAKSNPVQEYLGLKVNVDPNVDTPKADFYKGFTNWTAKNNITSGMSISNQQFWRDANPIWDSVVGVPLATCKKQVKGATVLGGISLSL